MSVERAFRRTRDDLARAGIDTASLDARLLVCRAAAISHSSFIADPGRPLSRRAQHSLADMVRDRCRRRPLAYILGEKEFWGRPFYVTADTLVPRPDSETLVAAALEEAAVLRRAGRSGELRILDLGTGSGCLLITLLAEIKGAFGVAIDRSPAALRIARANAERHGLSASAVFVCGSWTQAIAGRFDLIVTNPPYIATAAIAGLAPEIAVHEPHGALDGGSDGLDAYRTILPDMAALLRPGGCLAMELGDTQAGPVAALIGETGLVRSDGHIRFHRDLTGASRCIVATMPGDVHLNYKKGLEKQGRGVNFRSGIRGEAPQAPS